MLASQPASSESHPTPFFHSAELLHSNTLSQQRTLLSSGGAPQIWNKRTIFQPILDLPENTPDDRPRRSTRLPIPITDFPTKHHQEKSPAQIFLSFLTLFAHTDQRSACCRRCQHKNITSRYTLQHSANAYTQTSFRAELRFCSRRFAVVRPPIARVCVELKLKAEYSLASPPPHQKNRAGTVE